MATLTELSDRLWNGLDSTDQPQHHPFAVLDQLE